MADEEGETVARTSEPACGGWRGVLGFGGRDLEAGIIETFGLLSEVLAQLTHAT